LIYLKLGSSVKVCNPATVAQFASDSLSPPNGERAGVRGKHLKIKRILTPAFSCIGNGEEGEKPNCATANPACFGIFCLLRFILSTL
jgi:hypothetical protein